MSLDTDDDILQDFLVEAGELLEQLNEQLVELEQSPEDNDLLNAVFRSYHTIKGGASFLGLNSLVEVCHRAEDVFNVLRNGERVADSALMDVVLQATDNVNNMFAEIQAGEEPTAADPELLTALEGYTKPAAAAPAAATSPEVEQAPSAESISADAEFDQLLDAAGREAIAPTAESQGQKSSTEQAVGGEDITEEEFEALLDELHGKGKMSTAAAPDNSDSPPAADGSDGDSGTAGQAASVAGADENITEEEFETLLDELHGKGKMSSPAVADADNSDASAKSASGTESASLVEPEPAPAAKPKLKAVPKMDKPAAKPAAAQAEASVRVDTKRLDDIMNLVGELVLVRNRLATLRETLKDEEVGKAVSNLDVVTADLQSSVMKTRMQPIKKVFGRFPRVVRDLARSLDKEINLEMIGEDTDLDKNLVEALADPLVHLVRNAVDHGIEPPADREAVGKARSGTVILAAEQEGDHILLSIEDDGKGMNPDALRKNAVEKGLMDAESAARLDDKEAYHLIFAPGFSTKQEISDISGRGVGMDVVKTRIAQLNGSVEIDSKLGKGSRLSIRVPLTLAIMPTLMVVVGEQPFALPLASVIEIFDLNEDMTNVVDNQLVVRVREKAVPLFYLRNWLAPHKPLATEDEHLGHVVMVSVGNQRVGFVVDQLIGQEEVVIKPLGAMLQGMPGFAGATITGDGRIALILDVPSLMKKYAAPF